jgi:hypothetical protein
VNDNDHCGERAMVIGTSDEVVNKGRLRLRLQYALRALLMLLFLAASPQVRADDNAKYCSGAASFLNSNDRLEAFDRKQGGKDRRLQFRLQGREPCQQNECRLDIFHKATAPNEADRIVASVDLSHRDVKYCVYDLQRLKSAPRVDVDKTHQGNCPDSYLLNFFGIELNDPLGPFSQQNLDIKLLYQPQNADVGLDRCERFSIVDSMGRRHVWSFPFAGGSVVHIAETDMPRKALSGDFLNEYFDGPFVLKVYGASTE